MNNATRKRLEAAGWYRLPTEDGRGLWQHRSKTGRWTVEMSFRNDNPKTKRICRAGLA